ncbi:MAG TPA: glycine cleavage T C-terminal barrel domain-containing protein, partial [Steroidobacteraceae bacterium]|nr:glycine cleavage T C-terminal barrel domain-containing protein [Steroidobacteraceae bacterium]
HLQPGMDARLDDRRESTVMLAVQGQRAAEMLGAVLSPAIPERVARRHSTEIELFGHKAFISRTGYTGEDGFEVVSAIDAGQHLWNALIAAGAVPCGLGARDVLRLEAALALYGNDIDLTTNPYEAGLGWVVSLKGADFAGKAALVNLKDEVARKLVCFVASDRGGVFRHGYPLIHEGRRIGTVTSGSFSPTLNASIGMGYVPSALCEEGTVLNVEVRGRPTGARIVPRPFVPHH